MAQVAGGCRPMTGQRRCLRVVRRVLGAGPWGRLPGRAARTGLGQRPVGRRRSVAGCARAGSLGGLLRLSGLGRPPRAGGRGFSCLAGLALALRRWHGQQRAASDVARWGLCSARAAEACGRTAREWCSACAVRLDPCLSSDVLARRPCQSRGKRCLGLPGVGFLCCIPNAPALPRAISCLSPLALGARGEPEAAVASPVALASSCGGVVRGRQFGLSDSVDAVGMGSSLPPICPDECSLRTTVALASGPSAPPGAGRARATPASMRNATWLILPVVICLSQRLSHACVSMNKFRL